MQWCNKEGNKVIDALDEVIGLGDGVSKSELTERNKAAQDLAADFLSQVGAWGSGVDDRGNPSKYAGKKKLASVRGKMELAAEKSRSYEGPTTIAVAKHTRTTKGSTQTAGGDKSTSASWWRDSGNTAGTGRGGVGRGRGSGIKTLTTIAGGVNDGGVNDGGTNDGGNGRSNAESLTGLFKELAGSLTKAMKPLQSTQPLQPTLQPTQPTQPTQLTD